MGEDAKSGAGAEEPKAPEQSSAPTAGSDAARGGKRRRDDDNSEAKTVSLDFLVFQTPRIFAHQPHIIPYPAGRCCVFL